MDYFYVILLQLPLYLLINVIYSHPDKLFLRYRNCQLPVKELQTLISKFNYSNTSFVLLYDTKMVLKTRKRYHKYCLQSSTPIIRGSTIINMNSRPLDSVLTTFVLIRIKLVWLSSVISRKIFKTGSVQKFLVENILVSLHHKNGGNFYRSYRIPLGINHWYQCRNST